MPASAAENNRSGTGIPELVKENLFLSMQEGKLSDTMPLSMSPGPQQLTAI